MVCRNCGKVIPDNTHVCPHCECKVSKSVSASDEKTGKKFAVICSLIIVIPILILCLLYSCSSPSRPVSSPSTTSSSYTGSSYSYDAAEETEHVHTPVPIPDAEPTCDKDGHVGGSKCSVCGFITSSPTAVEKLGHTCTDGICERCGSSVLAGMTVQPSTPPKVSPAGQVARHDFEQAIKEWPEISAISAYTMLQIYDYIESEWSLVPWDISVEEENRKGEQIDKKAAEKYGVTPEQAFLVYGFVGMNYETVRSAAGYDTANPDNLKPKFGKLSKAEAFGSTLDITVKIDWILSDSSTVNQNYFNVCDMIQNQGADAYTTINYTAIMSTTDGGTTTVVFFVVPKSAIDLIKAGNFPEITLSDYVDDLWIHPQLKE